mgnify:CR=1 FL=1
MAEQDLFASAPLPVAPLGDAERLACLQLIRSENVGPVTLRRLINHFGDAQAALDALPALARRGGRRQLRILPRGEAKRELEDAHRSGATPLFTIEPGYPERLAHLDHPPPMIYAKGADRYPGKTRRSHCRLAQLLGCRACVCPSDRRSTE